MRYPSRSDIDTIVKRLAAGNVGASPWVYLPVKLGDGESAIYESMAVNATGVVRCNYGLPDGRMAHHATIELAGTGFKVHDGAFEAFFASPDDIGEVVSREEPPPSDEAPA